MSMNLSSYDKRNISDKNTNTRKKNGNESARTANKRKMSKRKRIHWKMELLIKMILIY